MKRLGAMVLVALLSMLALMGCSEGAVYQDGVYSAEFREFDSYGYKDFMTLTVTDGVVTEIVYNAVNEEGGWRSEDEKYAETMRAVRDTDPNKYTADLVNQYLEKHDIAEVDAVAGATWSSDSFLSLFSALEPKMIAGDTTLVLVDNVPEK